MRKLVGYNYKRLRERAGLTQHEVEARSGFSQQYQSGLENGQRNPTIITLFELSQAVGATPLDMLQPIADEKPTRKK